LSRKFFLTRRYAIQRILRDTRQKSTQCCYRLHLPALCRNWFSQLHFNFSINRLRDYVSTTKYVEYAPDRFQNLSNSFVDHNQHIFQISGQLSLSPSAGRKRSTDQSAVTLCGIDEKTFPQNKKR